MVFTKSACAAVGLSASLLLSQSARAVQFSQNDYVVVASHIDNVRQQTNIFQVIQDCSNSVSCSILAKAIASATGIPVDKMVTIVGAVTQSRAGEGTFMTLALPSGYSYCSSSMRLTSIVPHDGPKGSTFLGRADATSLYSETWTPVLGPFDGRSWVEGDLSVLGIRTELAQSSYANGKCHAPGRAIFYCRGGGCEGGAVDNGQSVDTSSPPGAGSRK